MPKPQASPNREPVGGTKTDEALMSAYVRGDARAFERLYARHKGALYRYFLRQLPEAGAHDCYQETWLKLLRAKAAYTPIGSFKAYLFTLAHNVLVDQFRKQMRSPATSAEEPDELPDGATVEAMVNRRQLIEHLHRNLRTLPIHQREAWLLKQETGLTLKEIAALTKTSEEGVKSRLRYATTKLRAGMAAHVTE